MLIRSLTLSWLAGKVHPIKYMFNGHVMVMVFTAFSSEIFMFYKREMSELVLPLAKRLSFYFSTIRL